MARRSVAAPRAPEKRAPKHPQGQHPFRAAGLQEPVCLVQNRWGRSGASLSPSRPASDGPGWEMSAGCQAGCVSGRDTKSQPGEDQSWECRFRRSIAVLGDGCMCVHTRLQREWGPWGGCTCWVPQPSLICCGGFPLAETSCAATEFRCRDGSCIGNSSRCNQFIDCEDASDEMNCSECPSCCPMFPATSPALPCCSSGDAYALCAYGQGPGSLHLISVFGTCAEAGREKGPGSRPVSRGQPRLAQWLEAAPAHHCSPPRHAWHLTT